MLRRALTNPVRKAIIIATAAVLVTAGGLALAAGQPGIVRTKTGVVYDGMVEEREDSVLINVRGIETSVPRDTIDSIVYGDFETRWNAAYEKLAPDDDKGRVTAARRAFDERRYDLAEKALRDAQVANPNNAEATELLNLTIKQRRMEATQREQREANPGDSATPAPGPGAAPRAGQYETLDPDQVNRIKQLEMRAGDTRTRVRFEKNVLKRFWDSQPALQDQYRNYGEFVRLPQSEQARLIIERGTAEMTNDVKIINDPEVFQEFKSRVHPLILRGCATSQCHGGTNEASRKFALVQPANDPLSQYTNFYLLQNAKLNQSGGVADTILSGGPKYAHMIDRVAPEQSLLLQYGLPPGQADVRHPKVRNYNGIFRDRGESNYAAVLGFIKGLNPILPDYGFSYELQRKGEAAPEPAPAATTPTTEPANGD